MKTKSAPREFKKRYGADPSSTPFAGFRSMFESYETVRADDVDIDSDGDMLLFQWGTYDWGDGPRFEVYLTRQFVRGDGEDEDIWQLHLIYSVPPSDETAIVGKGDSRMSRDDWCRRTTWTEADQRAFFERNRRSRGHDSKAQYMQIQAESLFGAGQPGLTKAALALLEQSFLEHPDTMACARGYELAGRCCTALDRVDDAVAYFRRALAREREFSGIGTNACFYLGQVAVEHNRVELLEEVLVALDEFGAAVFPWHAYMVNGIRAFAAAAQGDRHSAKLLARGAIEAAGVSSSGLGWNRDHVGVVRTTDTVFHRTLWKLAGA